MEEKISIIVPIYNVQDFLKRCIDSLIVQTYQNLEILLIDDGSTDGCGKICDEYAKKYKNIKAFHKVNGGLSDARNYGIQKATGSYIAFVDSDDFVNKDYCKILHKNLVENNADISICQFKKVKEESILEDNQEEIISVYEGVDKQKNILNYSNGMNMVTTVAWNKLYKKELWDIIKYPKGKINEDEFVVHQLMHKSHKVVYTSLILYYYYQREDSIMNMKFNIARLDVIEAFKNRMNFYKNIEKYNNLVPLAYVAYMKIIVLNYQYVKKNNLYEEMVKLLKLYRKEYDQRIKIKKSDCIKLKCFYYLPNIYCFIKTIIKK